MPTYIYSLAHPRTGIVRYVGKCVTSPTLRLRNHEYKARSGRERGPLGRWLRGLQKRGLSAVVSVLEVVSGSWQDAERKWVSALRAKGRRLLNRHPGGNGAHTRAALKPEFQALLGKMSDARIAERAGLCRETITYHRRRLGIGHSVDRSRHVGFSKGHEPHNKRDLPAWALELLGQWSDADLAKECGVTVATIKQRRNRLGIKAHQLNVKLNAKLITHLRQVYVPRHPVFGASAMARKYGVTHTAMANALAGRTWRTA